MLPDHLSRLLTAYVDGEASPGQRQAVERLLRQSEEARTLLDQLRADSQRLRALPRHFPETDLSELVLRKIAERRLSFPRRLARTRLKPFPAWVGLAVAASVLLVIGLGSFAYVDALRRGQPDQANGQNINPVPDSANLAGGPKFSEGVKQPTAPTPPAEDPDDNLPAPVRIAKDEHDQPQRQTPTPPPGPHQPTPDSRLAIPTPKIEGLQAVAPGVGLSLALRDLDRQELKNQLRDDLRRANAFRLDLFCLGNGKAVEKVQAAFRSRGVRLVIDPEAQTRLKNRRVRTDYALYAEGLTAEDLARILEQLGHQDRQAEAKRRGDGQFDKLFVLPFTTADRKELTGLLGVDPLPPPAKPKTPLGTDIRKPVSDGTAAQVAQTLTGQGTNRADAGKAPANRPAERLALLLPHTPPRSKPAISSKEVKGFLDARKEHGPGSVQVYLILHGVNG